MEFPELPIPDRVDVVDVTETADGKFALTFTPDVCGVYILSIDTELMLGTVEPPPEDITAAPPSS